MYQTGDRRQEFAFDFAGFPPDDKTRIVDAVRAQGQQRMSKVDGTVCVDFDLAQLCQSRLACMALLSHDEAIADPGRNGGEHPSYQLDTGLRIDSDNAAIHREPPHR